MGSFFMIMQVVFKKNKLKFTWTDTYLTSGHGPCGNNIETIVFHADVHAFRNILLV